MAIDEARLDEFIHRFVGDLGAALHASTVAMGDRLGLYRALADVGPADADAVAAASGCDRWLVQQWLDAQHLAGYCGYSAVTGSYWLSPEQAAVLAEPANPAFLLGPMTGRRAEPPHPNPKEHDMSGLEVNDFSTPDEVRTPAKTTVELVKVGAGEIGRYTFQPGWRWSECIKPVVGTDSCQVEHIGYLVSGTLHVDHDDGTSADITAGNVYRVGSGHDAHVVGDDPVVVVEFQGAATYARG